MSRIRPEMNRRQKISALGEGNGGALVVLGQLDDTYLTVVDSLDLAGRDIYLLYHDVCQGRLADFIRLLIAARMGVGGLDGQKLAHAARTEGEGIDLSVVRRRVDEIIESARHRFDQN